MLCNHKKSSSCLFVLTALLAAMLAGCGGDEPAPPTPPPTPPPRPVFVPKDVPIQLGESGEQVTLQTTEAGGFTLQGEPFTSGTTVEAAGNTYRLTLSDGTWTAEYVAPKPWFAALGTSGTNLVITRREDGLYEAEGDPDPFGSGAIKVVGDNKYRLTFVDDGDTGRWEAEYVASETTILLGDSGETVTIQRTEDGGYLLGETRVVHRYPYTSGGRTYRLLMADDGSWTAEFEPTDVVVNLGASGQQLTLQTTETGGFTLNGESFTSGSTHSAGGNTYRLTLADGSWTAEFVVPGPEAVRLGTSDASIALQRREDGSYYLGETRVTDGYVHRSGDNEYRLSMVDGEWTATFVAPPPRTVELPGTDATVQLQRREDGAYYLGNTRVTDGSVHTVAGDDYVLSFRNGMWTAALDRPATVSITLGEYGGTVTLIAARGGGYTLGGDSIGNGDTVVRNGRRYRLNVDDDGNWTATFRPESIRVDLPADEGVLILLEAEDGSITHNGDPVVDGTIVTHSNGNTYELSLFTDGWFASRRSRAPRPGDERVSLPGGETITLTRTSTGTYEYDGTRVRSGDQVTVGENRYVLTQASDGTWSARAVRDTTRIDTGGVAGPTQTDTVNYFTDDRFDDDLTSDPDLNTYGVKLSTRGEQPKDADDRGTKIVPQRSGAKHIEFPVYDLMQQGLATRERTYVEAAKAKLQEIVDIIRLNKELYVRDARNPHTHIAVDGELEAPGLWRQAEMAVGKIFGLTTFTDSDADMDGILGGDPWTGLTLDSDEVDDVISALEDTIATLSDLGKFGREYEKTIDDINKEPDPDTSYDAADYFNGLMSRIRFGSTTGARFGAYVVKNEDASGEASDAARGGWTKGVFAYTPSDMPSEGDIPDRGEATYRGSTVAVSVVPDGPDTDSDPDTVDEGNRKGATLYAGKIELVASFTRKRVKGTITELKDESGRTWEEESEEGRDKAVDSILLPDADLATGETGFYESATSGDAANATVVFEDSRTANKTAAGKFRVQIIDDAGEALGVWDAFNLEGAFGATRTGSVAKPTLRAADDSGGRRVVEDSVHWIINDDTTAVPASSSSPITSDSTTMEGTFSLDRTALGLNSDTTISDVDFAKYFEGLKLPSVPSRRVLSYSSSQLTDLRDASWTPEQIKEAGAFKKLDFQVRQGVTRYRYTRFGVWSQRAPNVAIGTTYDYDTIVGDAPEAGSFAYSPLDPVEATDISSLNFVADYEGKTLAVHRATGHLYEGDIRLVVSWGDAPTVESTITDLRGRVGTSDYFKHGTQDVKYIFFTGITATSGELGGTLTMSVRYRNSSRDVPLTGVVPMIDGVFVKDQVYTDEPVGVLGTWTIPSGSGIDAFSASFGAELKP